MSEPSGEGQCKGYAGDPGASAPRCESYAGHPGSHFIRSPRLDAARAGEGLREVAARYAAWEPNEMYEDWPDQMKADLVALRAALHPDTTAEPGERVVERLDRPGNRANGSTRP